MNAARFYRLALSLWGEEWRPELNRLLLATHGKSYSKQTLWNWRTGNRKVPEFVAEILLAEKVSRSDGR